MLYIQLRRRQLLTREMLLKSVLPFTDTIKPALFVQEVLNKAPLLRNHDQEIVR